MVETLYRRWIAEPLVAGVRFVRANPQIWSTALIALTIFVSFLFVADRFIRIAQDAQQQLSYVRVASTQSAIASLASLTRLSNEELLGVLQHAKDAQPTFVEMYLVEKQNGTWKKTLDVDTDAEQDVSDYAWFFELALIEPSTNVHTEMRGGVSGVTGFRAIPSNVPTVLVTHQQFSASDAVIQRSIEQSMLVLGIILGVVFFLLFHHARIIDYSTLYTRLKEVNQLKDDFISMASHELRSPLTAIRGYTSLIKERTDLPDNVPDRLRKIDRAAETLNQLIEDILDVSRIDQGRLTLTLEPVQVAEIVEDVAGLLQQKATEKGIVLQVEHIDQSLILTADRVRLRQVLINVIDNAIKYTSEGTVEIGVGIEKGVANIRISDSGIGMSAEDQQGLFQKFYRVNSSEVRKQTGTGLGLWITKELVERMQGSISVESIKGLGTHIILRFPMPLADALLSKNT